MVARFLNHCRLRKGDNSRQLNPFGWQAGAGGFFRGFAPSARRRYTAAPLELRIAHNSLEYNAQRFP